MEVKSVRSSNAETKLRLRYSLGAPSLAQWNMGPRYQYPRQSKEGEEYRGPKELLVLGENSSISYGRDEKRAYAEHGVSHRSYGPRLIGKVPFLGPVIHR